MAGSKQNNYFDMMLSLVELSYEAAKSLNGILSSFDPGNIAQSREALHEIEHNADIKKHEMIRKLSREFITPIEREDIMQMAQAVDDVTDGIEEVIQKIYMYNITELREEAVQISDVIVRCCDGLIRICREFGNFRKSTTIHQDIVEVNRLEEEGDEIYAKAMRRLFRESMNPVEMIVWRDMFDTMENCCDACEHVSDVVESVIMKNT
ncbi:MAG: DUF47 family protein [Firmicutes bacterium]|nr:DUF47 family protein [Bacillota bacterium]